MGVVTEGEQRKDQHWILMIHIWIYTDNMSDCMLGGMLSGDLCTVYCPILRNITLSLLVLSRSEQHILMNKWHIWLIITCPGNDTWFRLCWMTRMNHMDVSAEVIRSRDQCSRRRPRKEVGGQTRINVPFCCRCFKILWSYCWKHNWHAGSR